MLSIVMVARNVKQLTVNCLMSLELAVKTLGIEDRVEFVLADDASEAGQECAPSMLALRERTRAPVLVLRFTARQHYTRALAHAFSIAKGNSILFVSHDMLVTAAYIRTLLAVSALDASFGIVRGTSPYVDCFPSHEIAPSAPLRTGDDANQFSELISDYHGLQWEEDPFLTGDSMLIQPAALEKVGVFDPRYYGFFGDIDYGLRVQRAGLKLVCARGAWLLHEGGGHFKNEKNALDPERVYNDQWKIVHAAYDVFRDKWNPQMPPKYPGAHNLGFKELRAAPSPAGGEYQPRILPPSEICQML